MGEQVQLVRVSRAWEDRGSPEDLGGGGLQLLGVSRGWESRESPGALGEQVQVMRVSRG